MASPPTIATPQPLRTISNFRITRPHLLSSTPSQLSSNRSTPRAITKQSRVQPYPSGNSPLPRSVSRNQHRCASVAICKSASRPGTPTSVPSESERVSSGVESDGYLGETDSRPTSPAPRKAQPLIQSNRMDIHDLLARLTAMEKELVNTKKQICPWLNKPPGKLQGRQTELDTQARLMLRDAFRHPSPQDDSEILAAQGDLAKTLLDIMQQTLDEHRELDDPASPFPERNGLRRLLVKLSRATKTLPTSFSISKVRRCSQDFFRGGGFADIYLAFYDVKRIDVALKRLRHYFNSPDPSKILDAFYREALVWRQLSHPHILPFFGVDDKTFPSAPCMVSPYMSKGNVHDAMAMLYKENRTIPYDRWLLQIAYGLEYLHKEGIVHGDVRGANVLIDDDARCRLSDFGLAFFEDASLASFGSQFGGAARWLAPELLRGDHDLEKPTYACDVFSFARVCIEIYTRVHPFSYIPNHHKVIVRVLHGEHPKRPTADTGRAMSDDLWNLVSRCWSEEPLERPTMSLIVAELASFDGMDQT
ncbi:kinase-like protein [Panus rudis PR-1116 ss-1]|nr:kinase-like protein [Panus rudis PR-1116 ss-1]